MTKSTPFKINQVCFDSANKEYVKLTNGTDANGVFVPTEAIALRVVSVDKGVPRIAYTYRKVNPSCLTVPMQDAYTVENFAQLLDKTIGRI